MSTRTLGMSDRLSTYLRENWLRDTPIHSRLRQETAALGGPATMQISPEQGQFMGLLVELTGARSILEVGTFTGYSALCMALAMPAGGKITACDTSREWTAIAERYWAEAGVLDRIDLRLAPALDTLADLLDAGGAGTFDMAFIDADKENYGAYYERALSLLRTGGVMLFDNAFWGGRVADPSHAEPSTVAIRALNARLHGDERVSLAIVPIGDGLTLMRKRG